MRKRKLKKRVEKRFDDVLWDLGKAICIVETVLHALERVDDEPDVGGEYQTLKVGIKHLHSVHEALDMAISASTK
jgi:hypothetical protein